MANLQPESVEVDSTKSAPVPRNLKPIDRWLAIGGIAVGIAFSLLPKTPAVVVVALVVIFALLVHPLWYFWWIEKTFSRRIMAGLVFGIGLLVFGVQVWPKPQHPAWLDLNSEQVARFIQVLKSQSSAREQIRLGCAAYSEQTCVASAKFLDIFKRGGWLVQGDKIERVVPTKPIAGVAIFKYGHADAFDPTDPEQGKWTELSESLLTVVRAFKEVDITTVRLADEQLPQGVIGVFFGVEPN